MGGGGRRTGPRRRPCSRCRPRPATTWGRATPGCASCRSRVPAPQPTRVRARTHRRAQPGWPRGTQQIRHPEPMQSSSLGLPPVLGPRARRRLTLPTGMIVTGGRGDLVLLSIEIDRACGSQPKLCSPIVNWWDTLAFFREALSRK